jgi:tetratricopeptide (TPR) repeat protein
LSELNSDIVGLAPVPGPESPPAAVTPTVQAPAAPYAYPSQKDNILFLMGGLLIGFVVAYLMFEAMASRQPPRLTPALRAQIVAGDDGNGGNGGAPMGGGEAQAAAGAASAAGAAADPAAAGANGGTPPMAEIQKLREYVEKNPNDLEAVRKLADLNFDIQNWQRAQELYTHYLELKPKDTDVMTDLGITYRGLRQFDKALDMFHQAKKLDPNHWQSDYNEVVVLAFDLKKTAQANVVLTELRKMQPANPDVAKLAEAVARQPT